MAQVTQARKLTCNEQPQELSSPGGVTHHHPARPAPTLSKNLACIVLGRRGQATPAPPGRVRSSLVRSDGSLEGMRRGGVR